eukprot:1190663-Pleurochrysis_carterae.AAC.3
MYIDCICCFLLFTLPSTYQHPFYFFLNFHSLVEPAIVPHKCTFAFASERARCALSINWQRRQRRVTCLPAAPSAEHHFSRSLATLAAHLRSHPRVRNTGDCYHVGQHRRLVTVAAVTARNE